MAKLYPGERMLLMAIDKKYKYIVRDFETKKLKVFEKEPIYKSPFGWKEGGESKLLDIVDTRAFKNSIYVGLTEAICIEELLEEADD